MQPHVTAYFYVKSYFMMNFTIYMKMTVKTIIGDYTAHYLPFSENHQ